MGVEIERKFLVDREQWQQTEKPAGSHYRQGYLLNSDHKTIRVRVTDQQGFITFKGPTTGISRAEFEYKIPIVDGNQLLDGFALSEIEKIRYNIEFEGKLWEVDEFLGLNAGLLMAEIELKNEEEQFAKPNWVGQEVSDDERYYNSYLSVKPFKNWS
jgi:adenylate cyclase